MADWTLILQQAGLPIEETTETLVDGQIQVNARFSRELTQAEVLTYLRLTNVIEYRKSNSINIVKAIPNWSTWTQIDWQTYFNTNLSDLEIDKVTTIAIARTAMKRQNLVILNLTKLVLAMRDNLFQNL